MFKGFDVRTQAVGEVDIKLRIGGSGPPLLLLHGYPQTHVIWHRVAPLLADRFTLICADLRGYGESGKPPSTADHATYAKRAMARDMVELMDELGFARFAVAGHDRGGRVAHRLALDHPAVLTKLAVLDIAPTRTVFETTTVAVAMAYYHWFFLAQPAPLPETLIGADPIFYLRAKLAHWSGGKSLAFVDAAALAAYERAFADPEVIRASCEDYRAAASIDLAHDRADDALRIACPLLVLWGERGFVGGHYDVLGTWRAKAGGSVTGHALPCGHFLPEEQAEATAAALADHFA